MLKNAARLALMKPGAYLVNCARGGLINEGDVAAALQRGQLTGYGADVVEQEPVVPTNPLLTAPNEVLTPHVGSRTYESVERQAIMAVENMLRVPHGQPPHAQAKPWSSRPALRGGVCRSSHQANHGVAPGVCHWGHGFPASF